MIATYDASAVAAATPYPKLVAVLRDAFRSPATVPERWTQPTANGVTLLTMPAWRGDILGVKLVTVRNPAHATNTTLPRLGGAYVLFDGETGALRAILDGPTLTVRRTAATSALAASYLAPDDAAVHLVIGTGALALPLAEAHRVTRPIQRTMIWGRNPASAAATAAAGRAMGWDIAVATDLTVAVAAADIISTATTATNPLIHASMLRPGQHIDCVGAYRPDMREIEGGAIARTAIFVDQREDAQREAGDLIQARDEGFIDAHAVAADLSELCLGHHPGRANDAQLTLFKSVGNALEDLATAALVTGREVQGS